MSELDEIIERIEHWKKKGGIEEEDWVCDGPALYLIATEQREEIERLREALVVAASEIHVSLCASDYKDAPHCKAHIDIIAALSGTPPTDEHPNQTTLDALAESRTENGTETITLDEIVAIPTDERDQLLQRAAEIIRRYMESMGESDAPDIGECDQRLYDYDYESRNIQEASDE